MDRPIEYTEGVKRFEDMSPTGYIRLMRQTDGDVILEVCSTEKFGMDTGKPRSVSIEFCTSGGQSLNTLLALIDLIEAIKKDNEEREQHRETP